MAGIFNLFGGTTHAAKQSSFGSNDSGIKSNTKPTVFGNVGTASGKNVLLTPAKPKGLSMRSRSELNVVQPNGNGNKSPRMKEKCSKMEAIRSKQLKAASSRTVNDLSDEKKQTEETIFKKPLTPKTRSNKIFHNYPSPEKLSYPYDERKYFDCSIDSLDREFIKFVRTTNDPIKPYEDEGFESDPELIFEIPPIPDLTDDDILVEAPKIDLPELSDDDDDNFLN